VLYAQSGSELLDGGTGIDTASFAFAGTYDSTLVIDLNAGTADSAYVHDSLVAIENITGSVYADMIIGDSHANVLSGQQGDDTIAGGGGMDSLYGGKGNDVFVFDTMPNIKNVDVIEDFTTGSDSISLDSHVYAALGAGPLDPGAFQAAAQSTAAAAGIHIVFNTSTGALFYDPDGAGGAPAVQFATILLSGLSGTVSAADFVIT